MLEKKSFENHFINFSNEFQLIIALGFDSPNLKDINISQNNLQKLIETIQFHKFLPLTHNFLTNIPDLQLEIKEQLLKQFQYEQASSLNQVSELFRIIKKLDSLNISVICLKGPILSYSLYNDFTKRISKDLDLLVDEHQLEEVQTLLLSEGYLFDGYFPSSPKQKKEFIRARHHYTFVHPEKQVTIELHWKLLATVVHSNWNFKSLTECCKTIQFSGTVLKTLGEMDLALYLCLHGNRHQWFRLFWLKDLQALLDQKDTEFVSQLLKYAEGYELKIHVINAILVLQLISPSKKYLTDVIDKKTLKKVYKIIRITKNNWLKEDKKTINQNDTKQFNWHLYVEFYKNIYYLEGFKGLFHEWKVRQSNPANWSFFVFTDQIFFLNKLFYHPIWLVRKITKN